MSMCKKTQIITTGLGKTFSTNTWGILKIFVVVIVWDCKELLKAYS